MIIDKTNGKLTEVKNFAEKVGKAEQLQGKINYLDTYACNDGRITRCTLFPDFAPYSFEFLLEIKDTPQSEWRRMFNGGLIFHGSHDNGGDGSAPTFSVNLSPVDGWSIHT